MLLKTKNQRLFYMPSIAHVPHVTPQRPSLVVLVLCACVVCFWAPLWLLHLFARPSALGCAAAGSHEVSESAFSGFVLRSELFGCFRSFAFPYIV